MTRTSAVFCQSAGMIPLVLTSQRQAPSLVIQMPSQMTRVGDFTPNLAQHVTS